MQSSRGSGRGRQTRAGRLARRVMLLFGLVVLVCGVVWSMRSVEREPSYVGRSAHTFLPEISPPGQCLTVPARESVERESCFFRVQRELIEGWIDLDEAAKRLDACGGGSPALRLALDHHAEIWLERNRARVAYGYTPGVREQMDQAAFAGRLDWSAKAPSPGAVDRLRRSGIRGDGPAAEQGQRTLGLLGQSASLRAAFREVFGPRTADDLELLLTGDPKNARSVVVGNSVVRATLPPPDAVPSARPAADLSIITLDQHTDRVIDSLEELELARLRYLGSAGELYRVAGSIGALVDRVRDRDAADPSEALAQRAAADQAALLERLQELEKQLGTGHPLAIAAREGVVSALQLSRACEAAALRRNTRVRTAAGLVTGLTGAAVMVVAGGVTGTLIGGITIAAALQAGGGAYLAYRSEQANWYAAVRLQRQAAEVPRDEEQFARPDRFETLAQGQPGVGQGRMENPSDQGHGHDGEEGEGEGEEFEEDERWSEPEPRRNTIPALLPPPPADGALDLPPMLTAEALQQLGRITLAEAQQRIDEFLALNAGDPPSYRPQPFRATHPSELIAEARESLRLWVESRELAPGFASFFVRAEVETLPEDRRAEALGSAGARYANDRSIYQQSRSIEDLRRRVAQRLVSHCRAGSTRGDLMLQACSDPTALTLVLLGAVRDAEVAPPPGATLAVQADASGYHPVLYYPDRGEVVSLSSGETTRGVVAPLYHPASFFYSFLADRGERPNIDPDEHLLIARADPAAALSIQECEQQRRGLGRALDWIRSLVGAGVPSRDGCGVAPDGPPSRTDGQRASEGRSGTQISIRRPSISRPMGGGSGPPSGGQGGGGGGGGSESGASGSRGSSGGAAGGGSGGGGGAASEGGDKGNATSGKGDPRDTESPDTEDGVGGGQDGRSGSGGAGDQGGAGDGSSRVSAASTVNGSVSGSEDVGVSGTDDSDGYATVNGVGSSASQPLDLGRVARESSASGRGATREEALRSRPWRLREDHSFIPTGARVLYADNEPALSRFRPDDRFITMAPTVTEELRRMFEADSFPVFSADTQCSARRLPPRRVFRRATGADDTAFRYIYCDQDESMVIFREREEAERYGRMAAADRPLLLTRLASERIASFERSTDVAAIHAFLRDPDLIRTFSTEELDSIVGTAGELIWLQETLEATLFLSMHELEGSSLRGYYYDLHRQVAQNPFIVELVTAVHAFNQRLASDPLRTLAWADALPPDHRQRFFRLYFTLGGPMYWPDRWETLHRRYSGGFSPALSAEPRPDRPTLDFLQVMSDPTRVQVDWPAERPPVRPSIRDRRAQQGLAKTRDDAAEPMEAEQLDRQETVERRRGGTRGLGRAGTGTGLGPEHGRRPLQMIQIRVQPETGEPDRPRLPENNPTRPGGTVGQRRVQEKSASWQEPVLWLSPATFVDAILSPWAPPRQSPAQAERVPAAVRFSPRLRKMFLENEDVQKFYESRITYAVSILSSGGWLRYAELREAMGGDWSAVRAFDTGRFAAEVARNAAIVDQDQVRGANYFTRTSIDVPADLFDLVRHSFNRYGTGNFDLQLLPARAPMQLPPPDAEAASAREQLLHTLQLIQNQAKMP